MGGSTVKTGKMMNDDSEALLRATANATQAGDWALVLAAAGIEYRLDEREGRFVLAVDVADAPAAETALSGFDAEGPVRPDPAAPDTGASALGILSAIGLCAMFLVAGPSGQSGAGARWFEAGAASAERIASGQWWRALTALTLHADLLHLAGNVVATLIFVAAVGRWLGGGLGALTILTAAGVANLLTAAVHRTAFVSVGASTATFAALGLCAGLQVVRRLRGRPLLIFKPSLGVSTPWAYEQMAAGAPQTYLPVEEAERRLSAWIEGTADAVALQYNSLEPVVFRKFLALPVLLDRLRIRFGLSTAMSGSGSACFAWLPPGAPIPEIIAMVRDAWGAGCFVRHAAVS